MAMRPSKYTLEQEKKPVRKCNRCGCDIEWVENRNGKGYFADVVWNRDNYGNLRPYTNPTMFHRCKGDVSAQIAQLEKNIAQIKQEIAEAAADACAWFDPTDTLKIQLEVNEKELAALKEVA